MSTYWHFECIDHVPPLASEEFTQHTDDAPYHQGIELAAARPLDPAWWESNQGGAKSHFERNARSFLDSHPACRLEAVSEYGDRREVPSPNATAPQAPTPADPDYAEFERHEQELFRHQPVVSRENGQIIGCQCLDRSFQPSAEDWGTHLALVMRSLTPHPPTREQIKAVREAVRTAEAYTMSDETAEFVIQELALIQIGAER
jgi:hypothetical protein